MTDDDLSHIVLALSGGAFAGFLVWLFFCQED